MGEQWHYARAGKQSGPVSAAELKQLASSGHLSPTDMVWKEGMSSWVPAEKVKRLFTTPHPVAAPPLPQPTVPTTVTPDRGERVKLMLRRWGIILMVGGLVLTLWVFARVTTLEGQLHKWSPPFSNYEIVTIVMGGAAMVWLIFGSLILFGQK